MAEKYLLKRGAFWYFNFKLPGKFGGKRIRHSINTKDIDEAKRIRDKYVIPLLASVNTIELLDEIKRHTQILVEQSEKNIKAIGNVDRVENPIKLHEASELYEKFLQVSGLRPKSVSSYKSSLKKMRELFGNVRFAEINKNMTIDARDKMIEEIGATRIKFNFQCWRGFLRWCMKQGYVDDPVNEMLNIPLPRVRKKHTSDIPAEHADDATLLLDNWTLAPRIARYTGMRLMEVTSMTENLIVKRHGIKCFHIPVEISKTDKERFVPIADKLLPYIDDLSELAKTGKKNDKYNREIKKIGGCEDCKFHSWRVYANTQMMQSSVDETVRKRILGHKDGKNEIHAGYTHVRIEEMKKAVDRIF